MSLKVYQDTFKREQVNGEILSECDEDVLVNDLGVSSKLHRIKLMKVISGKPVFLALFPGPIPRFSMLHAENRRAWYMKSHA